MSIFKDKKVLVTGAAGLCGTAVVNRLLKMGDCSIIGTTYTRRDLNIENSNLNLVCFYYLITYFIPIIPSGSFFSTLTSTLFWINFMFYIVNIKKR